MELDDTHIPIVIASWRGEASVELVDRYFDAVAQLLAVLDARAERALMLTLTNEAKNPSGRARRRIHERTDELRELLNRVFIANGVVVTNQLIRGVLVALSWVDPELRIPYMSSLPAALEWAEAELAQVGLGVPASLRGLAANRDAGWR